MKKLFYILIFVLTVLCIWSFVDGIKKDKEFKRVEENYRRTILRLAIERDSLDFIIVDLNDSIAKSEGEVVELEKSQEKSYKQAQQWRAEYLRLKEKQPVTVEDSLEVSEEMVVVLVKENEMLDESLTQCDSVKVIQRSVIKDLKVVISTKDLVIANRDRVIEIQDKELEFLRMEVKEQKKKKFGTFLKGALSGALVIGILILI